MKRILVIGALGQIGSALVPFLRERVGDSRVIATDIIQAPFEYLQKGPFERHDYTKGAQTRRLIQTHDIDTLYCLTGVLSATAETNSQLAFTVNLEGLYTTLELAKAFNLAVFFPSSISVFGPDAPKQKTPQVTPLNPSSFYGVTKVSGELMCQYYWTRYKVDCRSIRLPGLISDGPMRGGGTTDYAGGMLVNALKTQAYDCFLKADTYLDMIYMPDAVSAIVQLMSVQRNRLNYHTGYNLSAMSLSPNSLATIIQTHIPSFQLSYTIDDVRQSIADSWPDHVDDQAARLDWGWDPQYTDLAMAAHLINSMKERTTLEEKK